MNLNQPLPFFKRIVITIKIYFINIRLIKKGNSRW